MLERDAERAGATVDLAATSHAYSDPEHRADAREEQRGRVHAADDLHDEREERGIAPAAVAQRLAHRAAIIHGSAAHGSSSTEMRAA